MPWEKAQQSGGGSINVPDSLRFADTITRDDYFTVNPSRLVKDIYCTVAGQLQRYNGSAWENTAVTIKGDSGFSAPEMQVQYSASGTDGWSVTLNPAIHKFWRWSTDGGVSWSADGVRFTSDGGAGLTAQQEADLASNTAARHTHANKAVLDATTGTFTLARQSKLDNVQDTFKGTFSNSADLAAAFPSPLDGWAAWVTDTATIWSALAGQWSDTLATSVGDMLKATYDPQGVSADAFARANHTGEQPIASVTGLQAELDKMPVMHGEIDALDAQINDPATGILKALTDVDIQINGAGTGLVDRVTDLEQGGTSTTKFRTHSPSGKYEDGEIVQKDALIYKANGLIDGSVTPVPFVTGTGAGQWTQLAKPPVYTYPADRALVSSSTGDVSASGITAAELFSLNGITENVENALAVRPQRAFGANPSAASVGVVDTAGNITYGIEYSALNTAITNAGRIPSALTASRALVSNTSGHVSVSSVTSTELGYLDGVTSAIQTQLNGKQATITGGASSIASSKLTASRALISNSSGDVTTSSATSTELSYVSGVTSAIQTQLNKKIEAPDHLSFTTYGSSNGLRMRTSQPNIVFGTNDSDECYISGGGHFRPLAAGQSIGLNSTTGRWDVIYLSGGVNNSSDADLKENIQKIPDKLLDVWFDHVQPLTYEWIAKRGKTTNRIQVGLIAQHVIAAFEAAGIDWHEWDVVSEGADLDHDDDPLIGEKDDYYSLNYAACQLIEAMAVRRKLAIREIELSTKKRTFMDRLLRRNKQAAE